MVGRVFGLLFSMCFPLFPLSSILIKNETLEQEIDHSVDNFNLALGFLNIRPNTGKKEP